MHRNSKAFRRLLTVLLIAALMFSLTAPALASVKAVVNSNSKVYTSSGKAYNAPKGLPVIVSAVHSGWAKINYKGATGFIRTSQLKKVSTASAPAATKRAAAYTAKSTPVYAGASSSTSRLGTLSIGTRVYVVGKSGSYYRVQNSSGSVTGYIKDGYLTSKAKLTAAYNAYKKAQASKSSSGGGASSLISRMEALCGRPYSRSASAGDAPNYFNCSTFVSYVMGKCGIPTMTTAAEQAYDRRMTLISSLSDLKFGDILCFNGDGNPKLCVHTAIYVGGGVFYEASEKAEMVHRNSFTNYYRQHFMWALRPR